MKDLSSNPTLFSPCAKLNVSHGKEHSLGRVLKCFRSDRCCLGLGKCDVLPIWHLNVLKCQDGTVFEHIHSTVEHSALTNRATKISRRRKEKAERTREHTAEVLIVVPTRCALRARVPKSNACLTGLHCVVLFSAVGRKSGT